MTNTTEAATMRASRGTWMLGNCSPTSCRIVPSRWSSKSAELRTIVPSSTASSAQVTPVVIAMRWMYSGSSGGGGGDDDTSLPIFCRARDERATRERAGRSRCFEWVCALR
eukprot:7376766-Prymnesium_polylepis.1